MPTERSTNPVDAWSHAVAFASAGHDAYPVPETAPLSPVAKGTGRSLADQARERERRDPADPWERRRPRLDLDEVFPHQFSFAALHQAVNGFYSSARKDEALRNSREHAQVMWRDGTGYPLIRDRQTAVTGLPWSIEASDPKVHAKDKSKLVGLVTELAEETPGLTNLFRELQDALWFGLSGSQLIPDPAVKIGPRRLWGVEHHYQVQGDKFTFKHGGCPGVFVFGDYHPENATIKTGDQGNVLLLDKPAFRDKFLIHDFEPSDFSYLFEPEKAAGIFGVGLRARIYWPWNLWKELQSWWWSGMETFGANGNWLYRYMHDNPAQRDAMMAVAERMSRNVHVLLPVFGDFPKDVPAVQQVPPTNVKFEEMRAAMDWLWTWMKAIVWGGFPEDSGGDASKGKVPEANEGRRSQVLRLDAKALAECLTRQFLRNFLLRYNEWDFRKVRYPGDRLPFKLRWKFQVDDDAEEGLAKLATYEKVIQIFNMQSQAGLPWPIDPEQIRDAAGVSAPRDDQMPPQAPQPQMVPGQGQAPPNGQGPGAPGAGANGHAPGKSAAAGPNGAGRVPSLKPSKGFGSGKAAGVHAHAGGTGIGRPHVQQRVAQARAKPDRFGRADGDDRENCGTGAGGFRTGNTCAAGGGVLASREEVAESETRIRAALDKLVGEGARLDTRQYLGRIRDLFPGHERLAPGVGDGFVFYSPTDETPAGKPAAAYTSGRDITLNPAAFEGQGTSRGLGHTFLHELEHVHDEKTGRGRQEFTPRLRQMVRELEKEDAVHFLKRHGRDHAEDYVRTFFGRHPGHEPTEDEVAEAADALIERAAHLWEMAVPARLKRAKPNRFGKGHDVSGEPRDEAGKWTAGGGVAGLVGGDAEARRAEAKADWQANGVKSKAFKAWFGDWDSRPKKASKVVDADGKPLVVYHGHSENFDRFELRGNSGGFFFAADPDEAATPRESTGDEERLPHVMPVYLNIRNPLRVDPQILLGSALTDEGGLDWDLLVEAENGLIEDAKAEGHDGLIIGNSTFVVFDPKQIKHAENRGTFRRRDERIRLARRAQDDSDPGVMVAWFLPPDLAEQLAVPDGTPPDEMHVTLCYLGRLSALGEDDDAQRDALDRAEMAVAEAVDAFEAGPDGAVLEGTIGGIGRFPPSATSDGLGVAFVPVDVPGLERLRQEVVERLEAEGLPVAADHGFTPHVTLTYVAEDGGIPDVEMEPVGPFDVTIDGLTLAVGDERREIPLGMLAGK